MCRRAAKQKSNQKVAQKIHLQKITHLNFEILKIDGEKQKLKFTSDNTVNYNSEFLLSELTDALSKAQDTSPGTDNIHYQLL